MLLDCISQVSGKEVVMWDEERVEHITEGEGDNRRSHRRFCILLDRELRPFSLLQPC